KLSSDPEGAISLFGGLAAATPRDDLIIELGLQGLVAANNPSVVPFCVAHASSTVPSIKALARKVIAEHAGKDQAAVLATIIREEGPGSPLGRQAIERGLDPRVEDPNLLIAVADKATESQHQLAVLGRMSQICSPVFKDAVQKLTTSPNADVAKKAQEVLGELKGQEKAK